MKIHSVLHDQQVVRWRLTAILLLCILFVSACGGDNPQPQQAERVNGFGTNANHSHSLIALSNNVLVLASHYGIFRSQDGGTHWTEVAGGPGQLMQGLMTYSLVSSPLNPQRLYVFTQPVLNDHKGVLGVYTSTDEGQTWKMSIENAKLTSGNIYLGEAGNSSAEEVYIYIQSLGVHGIKVSKDAGVHFSDTGTLPFGSVLGLLAIPGSPGHLLVYGNDGIAFSSDGGAHWQQNSTITGAIFRATTSGANKPIYVSGDGQIYVSNDGGKTFSTVNMQANYGALIASPAQEQTLYGKTARAIYRSTDGGKTWQTLPSIKGNLENLAPDPTNTSVLYLAQSYPTAVYRFDATSNQWSSLTPK